MDGACKVRINWNRGGHGGWCTPNPVCNNLQTGIQTCSYTYVNNTNGVLDPYFYVANHFGWANDMFQTNQGPSLPAHQFLFAGTSAPLGYSTSPPTCYDANSNGWFCYEWFNAENMSKSGDVTGCIGASNNIAWDVAPNPTSDHDEAEAYNSGYPCYEHNTLGDLMDTAGVSWKYYARLEGQLWTAPTAIQHLCDAQGGHCQGADYITYHKVSWPAAPPADQAPILTDIQSCQLQAVSFVIPDGNWSDHAGGNTSTEAGNGGPSWVSAIINQVAQASSCDSAVGGYWYDTAILVTWDDWGGYYDDVPPFSGVGYVNSGHAPAIGVDYVYGFRVPLLVVSAYDVQTPQGPDGYTGYVSNVKHDFGSILNFIEYAFGLSTIGDPNNWPFADFFAPDAQTPAPYGLYDFFNFNTTNPIPPPTIPQGLYPPDCFHHPWDTGCFYTTTWGVYPDDPDADASETD